MLKLLTLLKGGKIAALMTAIGVKMLSIVSDIFGAMGEVATGFTTFLTNLFNSIVPIFWTAPTGSETTGSLTLIGTLTIVSAVIGLALWAFGFIRRLIRFGRN